MPHKLADLALGTASAIETVRDGPTDVVLSMALSRTERRQVEELAQHAGRVQEITLPLGGTIVVDTSPRGENTIHLSFSADAGQVADQLADDGWFAFAECQDDWQGSTTVNRLQLALKRIAGRDEAEGITHVTTEFIAHDF